jgi:hypothetical protein
MAVILANLACAGAAPIDRAQADRPEPHRSRNFAHVRIGSSQLARRIVRSAGELIAHFSLSKICHDKYNRAVQ